MYCMGNRRSLSEQQRLFAKYYASLNNGTAAAKKAGYSPKSADVTAVRLLKDQRILGEIDRWSLKSEVREIVDEARLERELECAALLDPRKIFNKEGRLLDPIDIDEDTARAIQSMKIVQRDEGRALMADVKFVDKLQAIHKLGQQKGMFVERREYTHKLSDLTTEELEAELARIRGEHHDVLQAAEDHGVTLN
jgi:phage terminase small subunit